jgi:hypothetical protein
VMVGRIEGLYEQLYAEGRGVPRGRTA